MAGQAEPERPGDETGRGKQPGSPDRASRAGQAAPGDGVARPDTAASAEEAQSRFRAALERKHASETGTGGAAGRPDAGKIHRAHGPAGNRRSFRRKSG